MVPAIHFGFFYKTIQQLPHASVRNVNVNGLLRIFYPQVGSPDELQQFRQGKGIVIEPQPGILFFLCQLGQVVGAVYVKIAVAQIGNAGAVTVFVSGFGVAGQKPFHGWVVPAVAGQKFFVVFERGKKEGAASYAPLLHKFVGVT